MYRIATTITISLIFALGLCVSDGYAVRKKGERPPQKPAQIRDATLMLVPRLAVGFVVGKAGDYSGERMQDKVVYGGAISLEYHLSRAHAVAFSFDVAAKDMNNYDLRTIRMFSYSVGWFYRFSPGKRRSGYIRPELGLIKGTLPDYYGSDLDLGTHPYLRLGLGLFGYTSGRTNTRFEVFYKRAITSGHELDVMSGGEINFNAQEIGFELGLGVPLW